MSKSKKENDQQRETQIDCLWGRKRTRSKQAPVKMELMTGEEKEVVGFENQEAIYRNLREFLKALKAERRLYENKQ